MHEQPLAVNEMKKGWWLKLTRMSIVVPYCCAAHVVYLLENSCKLIEEQVRSKDFSPDCS